MPEKWEKHKENLENQRSKNMLYDVVSQKSEKSIVIVHNVNGLIKKNAESKVEFLKERLPELGKIWIRESEV